MSIWDYTLTNIRQKYENTDSQVTTSHHGGIFIEAAREDDFKSTRDRLIKAGGPWITQHKIHWTRSAEEGDSKTITR